MITDQRQVRSQFLGSWQHGSRPVEEGLRGDSGMTEWQEPTSGQCPVCQSLWMQSCWIGWRRDHSLLVTVEENVKSGGFGEHVAAYMEACHPEVRVLPLAIGISL